MVLNSVTQTWDEKGYHIDGEFGNQSKTIIDVIKKKESRWLFLAELSLFYDAVLQDDGTYDRAYTSADWAKYFENIFRNGVMMSVGEALRVTALILLE